MATLKEWVRGTVVGLLVERPGAGKTLSQWLEQLENDTQPICDRALATKNAQKAQKILRHISGIERWGQRRLRVFLGETFVLDEYNSYQPATDLTTEQQVAEFRKTRAETVEIVRKIAASHSVRPAAANENKVQHNQFGPLSVRGWLRYLDMHANMESKKIR